MKFQDYFLFSLNNLFAHSKKWGKIIIPNRIRQHRKNLSNIERMTRIILCNKRLCFKYFFIIFEHFNMICQYFQYWERKSCYPSELFRGRKHSLLLRKFKTRVHCDWCCQRISFDIFDINQDLWKQLKIMDFKYVVFKFIVGNPDPVAWILCLFQQYKQNLIIVITSHFHWINFFGFFVGFIAKERKWSMRTSFLNYVI